MTVIDCRFRPLTPEFECYITPEPANFWVTQTRPLKPEPLETTMKYFRKMGITGAVCSGRDMRSVGGAHIPNEYIADLVKQYPVFIGVAGADPQNGHVRSDIEHAVRNLGLKGVSVDPFALKTTADDKRFYPIYETCAELNVPVIITIGPLPIRGGSYIEWGSPLPVDHICADLPDLRVLLSHAGFPWTQELIAIVWRHENLYFESSIYRHLPGADLLVEAVNTCIGDKMCYASAYPYADYTQALPKFLAQGYDPAVLPKILHENAERLFGLNGLC